MELKETQGRSMEAELVILCLVRKTGWPEQRTHRTQVCCCHQAGIHGRGHPCPRQTLIQIPAEVHAGPACHPQGVRGVTKTSVCTGRNTAELRGPAGRSGFMQPSGFRGREAGLREAPHRAKSEIRKFPPGSHKMWTTLS